MTEQAMRVTLHTSHFTRHTSHFTRHTSHVTRHTSQVRNLERSLGTVVKDFERERNRVLSSHANFTEDLELENKGLRSVLKVTCGVRRVCIT